jgi:hypothetical protein
MPGAEDKELHYDEDESDSGSESEEESDEDEDTGLTENQNRLLYMISLYTQRAESRDDKGEWIRKAALLVLIYEGIVAQVLDYDYAPMSEQIENRRVYLNISQEGKSDVEFLREEELVNGLMVVAYHSVASPRPCSLRARYRCKRRRKSRSRATRYRTRAQSSSNASAARKRRPCTSSCTREGPESFCARGGMVTRTTWSLLVATAGSRTSRKRRT